MEKSHIQHLESFLGARITNSHSVSGGDIAAAFILNTENRSYFCKMMSGETGKNVLQAEEKGLEELSKTNTISIPTIYGYTSIDNSSFLVLEYINTKRGNSDELYKLGSQLASLHTYCHNKKTNFGWNTDNFIGRLNQKNAYSDNWVSFYTEYRILPQIELAINSGLLESSKKYDYDNIVSKIEPLLPQEIGVSLLHGDLWGGNFIISSTGEPYLIDPSVYYGHYEVDLAMTRLFGGFSTSFYDGHRSMISWDRGIEVRIELYQLYYFLVHLNLFGSVYYNSCKSILNRYF